MLEVVLQLESQRTAGAPAFELAKPVDFASNGLRVGNPLDQRAVFGETCDTLEWIDGEKE